MVTIYDFNPTREELCLLFHPKLADRTVEDYLDGRSQESLYRDVAALFHVRGDMQKMRFYLEKTTPQLRMDFLNSIGGF